MGSALLSEQTHVEAHETTQVRHLVPAQRGARAKLCVGVVGLGRQALEDHISGIAASDAADLVAICDDDPDVLRNREELSVTPTGTSAKCLSLSNSISWSSLFHITSAPPLSRRQPSITCHRSAHHRGGAVAPAGGCRVSGGQPLAACAPSTSAITRSS